MQKEESPRMRHDTDTETKISHELFCEDCLSWLKNVNGKTIHLTFVDPPFNQGKTYRFFNDTLPEKAYWKWIEEVLSKIYEITSEGGAIYFMQREKNAECVLQVLRSAGWIFQNLIIWKKKTSAIPSDIRFSKQYQIIAFATKGSKPRVFNKLRIDPPIPYEYKNKRINGIYIPDVWDDIRELTSGYFAGNEAIRDLNGNRIHIQQSPISLLARIILSSSLPGDLIFDPFAGTGTTLVVALQLKRNSVGIEIDPENKKLISHRLEYPRKADDISKLYKYYRYTRNIKAIWPTGESDTIAQRRLFANV